MILYYYATLSFIVSLDGYKIHNFQLSAVQSPFDITFQKQHAERHQIVTIYHKKKTKKEQKNIKNNLVQKNIINRMIPIH